MKNKIREAIEANNIPLVRSLMIELMEKRAGNAKTLLEISQTLTTIPGLFEPDNGNAYPVAAEITERHLVTLTEDLRHNFSLPKYRLFTEVHARIVRDPAYSLSPESPASLDALLTSIPQDAAASPQSSIKPSRSLKIAGYVIMILGLICAIVGICVPVSFMIGLGIGVLMLGSAVTYAAIPRPNQ